MGIEKYLSKAVAGIAAVYVVGISSLVYANDIKQNPNFSYDYFVPKVEFRGNFSEDEKSEVIGELEKTPDNIQMLLDKANTKYVVISEDVKITDTPEFANVKGKRMKYGNFKWDDALGGYKRKNGENFIFSKNIYFKTGKSLCHVIKHEEGHGLNVVVGDFVVGEKLSDNSNFRKLYSEYSGGVDSDAMREEFWADGWAQYIDSEHSRKLLGKDLVDYYSSIEGMFKATH